MPPKCTQSYKLFSNLRPALGPHLHFSPTTHERFIAAQPEGINGEYVSVIELNPSSTTVSHFHYSPSVG